MLTLQVMRVQYGSGNLIETPRGLVLENFLTHADPRNARENRFPKVSAMHSNLSLGGGGGSVKYMQCTRRKCETVDF